MSSLYLVLGLIWPSIQFAGIYMSHNFSYSSLTVFDCGDYTVFPASVIVLERQPSSLLIPVGEVAVLTCVADCILECSGRWRINGSYPHDLKSDLKPRFQGKGLSFLVFPASGTKYAIQIAVNASIGINQTTILAIFILLSTVIIIQVVSQLC